MMACASKEIVMGRHSNLGPIDPQVNGNPANEFVDLIKQAINDLDESKIVELYKGLDIDLGQALSIEILSRQYQQPMKVVVIECYETTVYLYL